MRLSWPFSTPNEAALELALLGIGMECIYISFKPTSIILQKLWNLSTILATVTISILIAATQSRAGIISYICAWIYMVVCRSDRRNHFYIITAALILSAIFLPGLDNRLLNSSDDLIHGERLILWKSSCAIACDYPWWGIGGGFRELLNVWYI